jgi:hypothetical protein
VAAMTDTSTITIVMPLTELFALAELLKRITYDDCGRLSSRHASYNGRTEHDVIWSAVNMFRGELATAGFAPR